MNNYKCKNPKTYSLTQDKEYTPVKIVDGNIYLTNDKGVQAKYSTELFEEVNIRTEEDVINSITLNANILSYININNQVVTINTGLTRYDSQISCGIQQVSGISDLMERINSQVSQATNLELQKALLKAAILGFATQTSQAIVIMSTNITDEDEDDVPFIHLCNYLTEISDFSSDDVENPNSGNTIKMWGFYTD